MKPIHTLIFYFFFCLQVQSLLSSSSSTSSNSSIYYLSFTTTQSTNEIKSSAWEYNISSLLTRDDSPFELISLPRTVVILGQELGQIYLNPNGALHVTKSQPCIENIFQTVTCNYNTSYFNLIAGYLTDLNPHNCSGSHYSFFNSSDSMTFAFRNLCYYGSTLKNSFRISLYDDSHIEIAYDKLQISSKYPLKDSLLSGLRPITSHISTSFAYSSIISSYQQYIQHQWSTQIQGIYPNRQDVLTGNKFIICPLSSYWCSNISSINVYPSLSSYYITITNLSPISCQKYLTFGLFYSFTPQRPTSSESQVLLSCNYDNSTTNTNNLSLICSLDEIFKTTIPISQNRTVYTWLTTIDINNQNTILPFDSIDFILYNSSSNDFSELTCQTSDSFVELFSQTTTNNTISCTNCTICDSYRNINNNNNCLNELFPCYVSNDIHSIYRQPSCQITNTCLTTNQLLVGDNYVSDVYGRCCLTSQLDCSGICDGTSIIAFNSDMSEYCCPNNTTIDCKGICGGHAFVDVCGICGGEDLTGRTCFNTSSVFLRPGNRIDLTYDVTDIQTIVTTLHIINQSPDILIAHLRESSTTVTMAPLLTYPQTTFNITNSSIITVTISADIFGLINGSITSWAAKTIDLSYYRIGYPKAIFSQVIHLYPRMNQCQSYGSSAYPCGNLPGCLFCPSSDIRILKNDRSLDLKLNSQQRRTLQSTENTLMIVPQQQPRQLFSNFIPFPQLKSSVDGVCIDGWTPTDCLMSSLVNNPASSTSLLSQSHLFRMITILVLMNWFFSFLL